MSRTEHLIRIDRLSVSVTTRRLFAYSSYLLPNVDPRESLDAQGTNRNRSPTPVSYLQTREGAEGELLSMPRRELAIGLKGRIAIRSPAHSTRIASLRRMFP
jgi:hypothetical protein